MKPTFGSIEYILEQLAAQPAAKGHGREPPLGKGSTTRPQDHVHEQRASRASLAKWCRALYDAPEAVLAQFGATAAEQCDLFTADQLAGAFAGTSGGDERGRQLELELLRSGHQAVNGGRELQTTLGLARLFAVRDEPLWHEASPALLLKHFEQYQPLNHARGANEGENQSDVRTVPRIGETDTITKSKKADNQASTSHSRPAPVSLRRFCEGLRKDPERLLRPLGKLLAEKCDLFTAAELLHAFDSKEQTRVRVDAVIAELRRCRYRPVNRGQPVLIDGEGTLLFPVRDEALWRGAHAGLCIGHFKRFPRRKTKGTKKASRKKPG